jgi:hypothetical protein
VKDHGPDATNLTARFSTANQRQLASAPLSPTLPARGYEVASK